MGCSASKLEDEEAVQLCKDRKSFVRQAIEQRLRFASRHAAYVQSLKRVSLALRNYIDGDEHNHDFYSESCSTPPFTPVKKLMNPEIIRIPPKPSPPKPIQYEKQHHSNMVYYSRSGGNSAISVEESPRSPETVRVSSYYPSEHFGIEGSYFTVQSSPGNPSYFQSSPYDRPSYHPPRSPQNSQWDFFWNPFSSLENYGYPSGIDHEGIITSDDTAGLRRVREEEGIPDLEDEDEEELQQQQQQQQQWHRHHHHHQQEQQRHHHNQQQQQQQQQQQSHHHNQQQQQQQQQQSHHHNQQQQQQQQEQQWRHHHHLHQHQQHQRLQQQQMLHHHLQQKRPRADIHSVREDMPRADIPAETNNYATDQMHQRKEFQSHVAENVEVTKPQKDFVTDLRQDNEIVRNKQPAEETCPGFTVYTNRHPGSMSEVMRDIERQFDRICDSAQEVSVMLEASRTQYVSNSNELTAIKMLNPVTLFRTTSSRSTSSRFLPPASSCSRDDNYDSSSEYSDESCMLSGSHQSTLDRLYAWEKKLYEEVKSGERIRVAYEKKCMQLKRQDSSGEDHSSIDKTRKAARDLHTRIKISIHSIEAISRRIEKLRDEELHPQLLELIQGLARMWRTMADSHRIQKRAIDEAKLLLATPKLSEPPPPLIRLGQSASNLEVELRNWRSCLVAWITAQRSYVHALAGWLLRCAPRLDPTIVSPAAVRSPLSPPRSSGAPPIFNICIQWSRLVDSVSEAQAVDGLDFFAAGIASVVGQHREQATLAAKRAAATRRGKEEEDYHEGVDMSADKIAEVAVRVVCAGMSVAVSSLSEFALCSMEGYENVVRGGDEEEKGDT